MKTDIVHRLSLKICAVLFWREWWHPRRGCTQPTPPSRSKWLRGQSWLASQPPPVLYSHNSPLPGTKRETVSTSSHNLPCKFIFSLLFLPLTICLLLFVLSYVKFEREHQCLQGDTRNPQQFGKCSCQGEKTDEADSKEGESCLFLRVCCMSSGSPFSHFAACNMCSFSVSHSTNIFVSYCLQHHGPAMNYPCVLSVFLLHYPLLNLPLVSALVYERSNGANPTDLQMPMYFLSSLPSSPAHKVWPKSSPPWDNQPPCVLTAPALPKVWPREADPFSKRIRDSSITEAGVQTKAVFLETSPSHSQLICLIVSGFPHAC